MLIGPNLLRPDWELTTKEFWPWVWAFRALCATTSCANPGAATECGFTLQAPLVRQSFALLLRYLYCTVICSYFCPLCSCTISDSASICNPFISWAMAGLNIGYRFACCLLNIRYACVQLVDFYHMTSTDLLCKLQAPLVHPEFAGFDALKCMPLGIELLCIYFRLLFLLIIYALILHAVGYYRMAADPHNLYDVLQEASSSTRNGNRITMNNPNVRVWHKASQC